MANSRKRMWGVAAGAIALGIVGASVAVAGLVAGGGPTKSDCYAQWNVSGVDAQGRSRTRSRCCARTVRPVTATTQCNGTCVIRVKQCWNQADPEPARLRRRPRGSTSLKTSKGAERRDPAVRSRARRASVRLRRRSGRRRRRAATKPGKRNFKVIAKAPKGTKPRTDQDSYQLVCVPNGAPETCGSSPSGAFLD